MKKLIQSEESKAFITVFATISCLMLSPIARAVVPPPDGGYANFTTAEGQKALFNLTTGSANTAVGWLSLFSNAEGNFNTATGAGALLFNTADQNTAFGATALLFNTTGGENTATGVAALLNNTTGFNNTATGAQALSSNTTGHENSAFGWSALQLNTGGDDNTAIGHAALNHNTVGNYNTAIGLSALQDNQAGNHNTAVGDLALILTSGSHNTALGSGAGENLSTGDNNIDIGFSVQGVAAESNTIRIGNGDITDTFIRGISGATASGGAAVFVNANGKLGTMTSSSRFKGEIKPMDDASEAILALNPVTFRYKKEIDPQGIAQFGLVAEEVEKVDPDLVIRDAEGKPQTVRYEQINAMLLNEFLKEHKAFVEEHRKVQGLEKGMAALTATVKEQSAQIQKVSDRVELNTPAVQTVASDQ